MNGNNTKKTLKTYFYLLLKHNKQSWVQRLEKVKIDFTFFMFEVQCKEWISISAHIVKVHILLKDVWDFWMRLIYLLNKAMEHCQCKMIQGLWSVQFEVICLISVMSQCWSISIMASLLLTVWLHVGRRLQELLVQSSRLSSYLTPFKSLNLFYQNICGWS